ncbi:head GIN domain-containing protein [Fulvivirga ligni]|uniref:head GIN domain-containing protein n=1 Tax=Fulvivirga ligni TaxID=2904246 RepID=UPI001F485D3F|nr:head GIN domain-containing protein [Fulvivirga ligni]UII23612.1 DUF2807 domain-containing protein [Fulvivirga ligni]
MKKEIILMIILFAFMGYVGRAQESETRDVGTFSGVKSGQAIDVYLTKGAKESVKVEVRGIDLDDVETKVSGGELKIELGSGHFRNHSVKVYVTYVNLQSISASSAASIYGEGTIESQYLDIRVASAADIDVTVEAGSLDLSVSSSADINIKGQANRMEVSVSSAGSVNAYDLQAKIATIKVSSAGSAKVYVTDEIDARASSGGSVRYRGNPSKSSTNSSSGGSVNKSN